MQDFKQLGKRIQQIKEKFNYSNEELGAICGVSYTAIGNIINGITKDPSVSLFVKLIIKLEINPEWLLLGKGKMLKEEDKNAIAHPETIKYQNQEIENLKLIIESKQNEIDTLKKIISLLEEQIKPSRKQAS